MTKIHFGYTKNFGKIFNQLGMKVALKTTQTLPNLLGNPKDKVENFEKSGIYETKCKDCKDCKAKYFGQSRESVIKRIKDYVAHIKFVE